THRGADPPAGADRTVGGGGRHQPGDRAAPLHQSAHCGAPSAQHLPPVADPLSRGACPTDQRTVTYRGATRAWCPVQQRRDTTGPSRTLDTDQMSDVFSAARERAVKETPGVL